MDRLVYTAATGLSARMSAQAAIANNMANANTTGFRADIVSFDRVVLANQPLATRDMATEGVIDADRRPGAVEQTGRPLDVAVTGNQWIAVQGADGQEAYTRRGDLQVAPTGVLQTGDGFPVIGSGGPITVPPAQSMSIASDGTISIVPVGSPPGTQPQAVGRIKLASPVGSQTVKGTDNLLHVRGGGILPVDEEAHLQSGALEGSNVNMTQSLVDMIENQRAYEVQANLMKEARDMDENASQTMRLPS